MPADFLLSLITHPLSDNLLQQIFIFHQVMCSPSALCSIAEMLQNSGERLFKWVSMVSFK